MVDEIEIIEAVQAGLTPAKLEIAVRHHKQRFAGSLYGVRPKVVSAMVKRWFKEDTAVSV